MDDKRLPTEQDKEPTVLGTIGNWLSEATQCILLRGAIEFIGKIIDTISSHW